MNNIINITTPITYTGVVDAQYKIGNDYVNISKHNSGADALSLFFAKTLSGNYSKSDLPSYIDLVDSSLSSAESLLSKRIFIQSRQYLNNNGQWQTVFSIYISANMLKSDVHIEGETVYLKLCKNLTSDDYFAMVALDNVTINNEMNLVVNWALGITLDKSTSATIIDDELK